MSQKLFIMVVGCKKEEHGETIVDDRWDMDIGKAVYPVVQSEYGCGDYSTKTLIIQI